MRGAGVKKMAWRLKKLPGRLEGEMAGAVTASAVRAADTARRLVPVDSGALQRSIAHETAGLKAVVSASAPYAGIVEYGSSRSLPRPFMLPAAREGRDALLQEAGAAFSRAVKEVEG